MHLTAYLIVKRRHTANAFDGEGARRFGGRWNSQGVAVIYAASSQSLAMLELLVHLDEAELLQKYVLFTVEFPDLIVETVSPKRLPRHWMRTPSPRTSQRIGDQWIREMRSAALCVPSAIVPEERNYLFNPSHPDMRRVKIGEPKNLRWDRRLFNS